VVAFMLGEGGGYHVLLLVTWESDGRCMIHRIFDNFAILLEPRQVPTYSRSVHISSLALNNKQGPL
jgi:hypothetical protein